MPARRPPSWVRPAVGITAVAVDVLLQVLLIRTGLLLVTADVDDPGSLVLLYAWSLYASVYLVLAIAATWVSVHWRPVVDSRALRIVDTSPVVVVITGVAGFVSSVVGAGTAIVLLAVRDDEAWREPVAFGALWVMVLSWGMLHWMYARVYASLAPRLQRRTGEPALVFPGTADPRLSDFVYFAFTIGTAFSTSDVSVRSPRLRWVVTWHQAIAFLYNATIIVLVMNTVISM